MSGLFIVFEGLDGSGTTTQAVLMHEALLKLGRRSVLTSEPTQGPIGNIIRQIMTGRLVLSRDAKLLDRFLAYLFAADRFDHLYNEVDGILKYLREGVDIVSTRYFFSSLAYHVSDGSDLEFVKTLNVQFPPPDLAVYLECPVSVCLERLSRSRQLAERYENAEKLGVVKRNYEVIFDTYEGELLCLDASQPREKQHEAVLGALLKLVKLRTEG